MAEAIFRPGLVSITYRGLSPREIVSLCVEAQLEGVEWGGDIHVPHGDLKIAREVGQMTRDAGLAIACYGSYYRCDGSPTLPFESVLESAVELGAPLVRVWVGSKGSEEASWDETFDFSGLLYDACELAAQAGVGIVTEYHEGTLTDTRESCHELLASVGHTNLKTLWQPLRRGIDFEAKVDENLEDLRDVAPFVSNIHVYEWANDAEGKRQVLPLQDSLQWPVYIEELKKLGGERYLLLEYVPGDVPEALKIEAAALRSLIG